MNTKAKAVLLHNNQLWQDLSDRQSERTTGGKQAEGVIAWSIGFADVVRPSSSQAPSAVDFQTQGRSPTGVSAVIDNNPRIIRVVPL